jgi:hypothetical protein
MSLPPEGHFATFDTLEQHAQLHAQRNGYAVVTVRWKYQYKSRFRKTTMGCHCTRKYRDRTKRPRRRQKSTVKTDCPFTFLAVQDANGWTLKHRQGPQFARHNHGPTMKPSVHWQHRKLRGDALKQATALIAAGLEPKDIVSALSATLDIPPLAQDISNLIQKIQKLELNGNTPIDALLNTLDQQGWVHEYEKDDANHLTHLFIASKDCLAYAKKNPDILIIDSTYKTNRFDMPLLDIISM